MLVKLYKDIGCFYVNIVGFVKLFKFYKKIYFCKVNEIVCIINYGNFLIYKRKVLFLIIVKNLIFLVFIIEIMDLFEIVCYCIFKLF